MIVADRKNSGKNMNKNFYVDAIKTVIIFYKVYTSSINTFS